MDFTLDEKPNQGRDSLFARYGLCSIFYIFVIYVTFASLWVSLKLPGFLAMDFYQAYYLISLIVMTIFSAKVLKRLKYDAISFELIFWISVILLLFIVSKSQLLLLQLPWQDEYTQFINSLNPPEGSILAYAAHQQQPPLDYFLSAFSGGVMGTTLSAMRFHALLSSLLFFVSLFLSLVVHTKNNIISFLVIVYAMSLSERSYYTLDARPVSLCLFVSVFVFHNFLDCLGSLDKKKWQHLLLSSVFLTLTIGYQAEILLILIGMVTGLIFLLNGIEKSVFKKILLALVLTAFLFAPYFYIIYIEGVEQNQFLTVGIEKIISVVEQTRVHFGEAYLRKAQDIRWSVELNSFLIVFSIFFLGTFVYAKKKEINNVKLLASFFVFLLFPPLFNVLFALTINWKQYPRYMAVYYTPYFFLVGLLSASLLLNGKVKKFKYFFIISLIFLCVSNFSQVGEKIKLHNSWRTNFSNVYAHLNTRIDDLDRVYYFNVVGLNQSPYTPFGLKEMYVSADRLKLFSKKSLLDSAIDLGRDLAQKKEKTFYVVYDLRGTDPVCFKALTQNLSVERVSKVFQVVTITRHDEIRYISNIERVLNKEICPFYPQSLYNILVGYYGQVGKREELTYWFDKLENIPSKVTFNDTGQSFDIKSVVEKNVTRLNKYLKKMPLTLDN